jgi:hypothetical protein
VIGINSLAVAAQAGQGLAFAVAIDHATDLLNGQVNNAPQTPLTALTKAMGGPSDSDQTRARGEQSYAQVIEWADRSSAQLDAVLGQVCRLLRVVLVQERRSTVVRHLRGQRRTNQPDVVAELSELARCATVQPAPDSSRSREGR